MKNLLPVFYFLLLCNSAFAIDSLLTMQPFDGKVKLNNISLHFNETGDKLIHILQGTGYRKIMVHTETNGIENEWFYVFRTKKGLPPEMPTANTYNKINYLVAEVMRAPALHTVVAETKLTEVFTTDLTNFIITRTDIETGAFRDETIYMNPKEYALTSFLDKGNFYVLAINPENNFFSLYSSNTKTGLSIKKITPSFADIVAAGKVSEGDANFPYNLFPLEFSKENPAGAYSYVTVPGAFLPFEKNVSPVKYNVLNNTLSIYTPLKNGCVLSFHLSIIDGSCSTGIISINTELTNTILQQSKTTIQNTDLLLANTKPKAMAQTEDLIIVARTLPGGTIVLMYYSLSQGTQKHLELFSGSNKLHLDGTNARPGKFYTYRTAEETKSIDKFLRFASADESSLAINLMPRDNGMMYVSLEAIDGRPKFTDVAGAVVSFAAIVLPVPGGGSLASAFMNGAIVGAAGEALGSALSSINNPKMFFAGWNTSTQDFKFVNNDIPNHADFESAAKINTYLSSQLLKPEERLVAATERNGAVYLSFYATTTNEYKLVRFNKEG